MPTRPLSSHAPLLTIGLPVYNGAEYLGKAIQSIQAQTEKRWRLVIADNGSSDMSLQIARDAAARDPRISVMWSRTNRGAAWNYNRLVDVATTPFFKWHAHDDILEPRYVEASLNALAQATDSVLAYPRTKIIDSRGDVVAIYDDNCNLQDNQPSKRFRRHLFSARFECNSVFGVFRTEVLKSTVLIGSYPGSDFTLLGNVALLGKIKEVDELLFCRRDHSSTSIRANPSMADLQQWFDTSSRKKAAVRPAWSKLLRYVKLIWTMSAPIKEKATASMELIRWTRWFWRDLAGDFLPWLNSPERKRALRGAIALPNEIDLTPSMDVKKSA